MELIQLRMQKFKQKKKGFTLVELIVVIAIIGILAAVLLPKYFGFTDQARVAAVITEAKSIRSIAETSYAKNDVWPAVVPVTGPPAGFTVGSTDTTVFTGTIAANTGSTPLSDGSFKYTEGSHVATCDANGNVTGT